jgi:hypothetical protein
MKYCFKHKGTLALCGLSLALLLSSGVEAQQSQNQAPSQNWYMDHELKSYERVSEPEPELKSYENDNNQPDLKSYERVSQPEPELKSYERVSQPEPELKSYENDNNQPDLKSYDDDNNQPDLKSYDDD